jgi:hypothetical protein
MANVCTFTVNASNNAQLETTISSVTSSTGNGLTTGSRQVVPEGDSITWQLSGGIEVEVVGLNDLTLWNVTGTSSTNGYLLTGASTVVATAKTGVSVATNDDINLYDDFTTTSFPQYITHQGPYNPPVISGTTFLYYNNQPRALYELTDATVTYAASSFFVRTQINLSFSGSGGTLEYGRNTSSNSASGASWQTSGTDYNWPSQYPDQQDSPNAANVFNHLNNSTRYFFASRDRATAGAFDSTGGVTYSHVNPSTVTVNNVSNVAVSTTSVNVTINGCTTDSGGTMSDKTPNPISHAEVYSISKTDHGSTDIAIATISGDRVGKENSTGSSTVTFNIPSADMPAQTAFASETYYVYSLRRFEWSGDYLYDKTDTFTISRGAADQTPENYTELAGDVTNAPLSTYHYATFSTTTAGTTPNGTGFNVGTTVDNGTGISVSNGFWSTDAGSSWTSLPGTINQNDIIYFRGVSSFNFSTATSHQLTIGDTIASFTTTTLAQDTTPESFVNFSSATNQAKDTVITSNSQTITTITGNVNVSVSGTGSPQVSINGGAFTASPGTISNNQTIQVRLTSASTDSTTRTATVTIGTVARTFDVTTSAAGGSGTDTGSGGTSTYGIEVYAPNGTTTVLSPGTRYISLMNDGASVTVPLLSNVLVPQDMTGLTTSNSDLIFTDIFDSNIFSLTVSRESGGFRLTNSTGANITCRPLIIRY